MADFFRFLVEANLVTAAFVIGALSLIVAIIGKFKTIIEPSPAMRFLLAAFGMFLIILSLGSYFVGVQRRPGTIETPTQGLPAAFQSTAQPQGEPTIPQPVMQPTTPVQ